MTTQDCIFKTPQKGEPCASCGYTLKKDYPVTPKRNCPGPPCPHLGEVVTREGVVEKIKCSCPKTKGYREQWHQVHTCHAPEHQRKNGKPGRCLPTFQGPFDKDHQVEASIYQLCSECEVRKDATTTHS